MTEANYKTFSREETENIGAMLGGKLKEGDIVCLFGDLGVGKTAFISGIAKALGIRDYVTSPTFTVVNEYEGDIPLFHFDVYRVYDPDELYNIGFEEYFFRDGVVCIEWADLIPSLIPKKHTDVIIQKGKDPAERKITIRRYFDENIGW